MKPAAPQREKQDKPSPDEMFAQLFGEGADVDEVLQISFGDEAQDGGASTGGGRGKSENVATYRPRDFLKTGDRISNDIVKLGQEGEAVYRTGKRTSHGMEAVTTRVSFAYKNVDIFAPRGGDEDDRGFTSLDKEVHDAVVSLYAAGNKVFSPAMVYRTMAGKNEASFVPPEKLREVTASIYKCMSSIITIDAREDARFDGLDAMYSQNLIYAKAVTLKTKGWEVSAFMLIDEPVLYKYAKIKRQIFSVPLHVLDTPPSKTNDVIVLQGYLIRVVEGLRRTTKLPNVVLYSTLYELIGCQGAAKQKLQRIRTHVKSILNYWVEIGYIQGFTETTKDRAKHSIQLEVQDDKYLPPA